MYTLFWITIVVLVIYLAFKRIEARKYERFEKRDN